jgi:hypothetical protein
MAFIKRLFDAGKKIVGGTYQGIKTGLIIGRALLDVSRVVAKDLQHIPQLKETLQKYLNSENLKELDAVITKGQSKVQIIDAISGLKKQAKIAEGRRQLEQVD